LALYREEVLRVTRGSQEGSDGELAGGEVEPALRGGGLQLPSLKHWRLRRGLSSPEGQT
jgi:hypothetical protein